MFRAVWAAAESARSWRAAKNKRLADKKRNEAMAAERAQNLQDTFLNYVRKHKTPLTIFLVNGVKLQGVVTWFDNFCVLLRRDGHSQLVYKHAISTVMPGNPIQLFEPADEAPAVDKV
jgi:host factor-I protein